MTRSKFILGPIAALSLVAAGCGSQAQGGGELVGSEQQEQIVTPPVTWVNPVGVDSSVDGNLTKTASASMWTAGASSSQTITGDGYVTFTTGEATTLKMAGLSSDDTNQTYQDIDFAFYMEGNGNLAVYEGGVSKGKVSTYVAGDVLKVDSTGGVIRYYKNDVLLYTSLTAPAATLLVDTSLDSVGATIEDATLVQVVPPSFWQNAVHVTAVGSNLTRAATNGWTAGASSVATIAGDGYVTFTTAEANTAKMAGLSNGDTDQSFGDIDFAIYLQQSGKISIYEDGVNRGIKGSYAANDVFKVDSTGGAVTYWKGSTLLYTSLVASTSPLLLDTSLFSSTSTLKNASVVNAAFWQNQIKVTATGNNLAKVGASGWTSGASSVASIAGDGYVSFSTGEANAAKMAGASTGDPSTSYKEIDFAVYLQANGKFNVYENGVNRGSKGTYVANDVFTIVIGGGHTTVTYEKNGTPFYTSTVVPSGALLLDTSLDSAGATINNAVVHSGP